MGISAGNKKMVGGHFISDIIDSDVLKILLGTREVFSAYVLVWKTKTFSYTGADQVFEVPEDCEMTIECWGAGSNNASGGYAKGVIPVTKGQKLSFMIGGKGSRTDNGTTYGFGGSTTYGGRGGGGLSGVFTGDTTITDSDSARALVIGGGAGGGRTGGGAGGGETGQNGNSGSYGWPGGGGTQTAKGSGNQAGGQFHGGGGSGTYGFGGGGGWFGGGGSGGDGSGDDDAQAGGGSGYVLSSATDRVLTQGGGSAAGQDGSVKIRYLVKERPQPTPKTRLPREYQEVEYIQSDGGCKINTGVIASQDIRILLDFDLLGYQGPDVIMGTSVSQWSWVAPLAYNDTPSLDFFAVGSKGSTAYAQFPTNNGRSSLDFSLTSITLNDNTQQVNLITESYEITLFHGATKGGHGKIRSCKIYNGENLVRDFVPCYRVSDGTAGLYDLVEGKFYGNSGTGTFIKGASVNAWQMPEGYTELAYIESSGTQYINTGYTPNVNTEIETMLSWGSSQADWAVFYGVTSNDSALDGILGRLYYASSTGNTRTYNWWFCNAEYAETKIETTNDVFHDIKSKKNVCALDGTEYTITTTGTPYQAAIFLFCGNNGGSAWRYAKCKMGDFVIKEGDEEKRHFVPCVRDSDGIIGMYDLVTNEFFTNSGSGDFVAGPVVFRGGFKVSPYTKLYVKMDTDLIDHSGKDVNIANSGVTLNTSVANVGAGYFDGNSRLNFPSSFFNMSSSDFTISFWCRDGAGLGTNHGSIFNNQWTLYSSLLLRYTGTKLYGGTRDSTWDIWSDVTAFDINQDTWVLWTMTRKGSDWKIYKNNVLNWSGTSSSSLNYNANYTGAIGGHEVSNPNYYIGYISDFIVEQGAWSDQQRDEYFNATKALYGVS